MNLAPKLDEGDKYKINKNAWASFCDGKLGTFQAEKIQRLPYDWKLRHDNYITSVLNAYESFLSLIRPHIQLLNNEFLNGELFLSQAIESMRTKLLLVQTPQDVRKTFIDVAADTLKTMDRAEVVPRMHSKDIAIGKLITELDRLELFLTQRDIKPSSLVLNPQQLKAQVAPPAPILVSGRKRIATALALAGVVVVGAAGLTSNSSNTANANSTPVDFLVDAQAPLDVRPPPPDAPINTYLYHTWHVVPAQEGHRSIFKRTLQAFFDHEAYADVKDICMTRGYNSTEALVEAISRADTATGPYFNDAHELLRTKAMRANNSITIHVRTDCREVIFTDGVQPSLRGVIRPRPITLQF